MDFYILFAIAAVLITFEVFILSFVIIWFGLGFLLLSFIQVVFPIDSIIWQLCLVALFSLVLLVLFRKKLLNKFKKSDKEIKDDFLNESGYAEVKNGKIFFKGTFWEFEKELEVGSYKDGEKVFVEFTKSNTAYIKK